jgi:hypothetical protein
MWLHDWLRLVQTAEALLPDHSLLPLFPTGATAAAKFQSHVPGEEDSPSWSLLHRGSFYPSAGGFLFCMAAVTIIRGLGVFPFCQCIVAASGS